MSGTSNLDPIVEAVMDDVIQSRSVPARDRHTRQLVGGAHELRALWTAGTTGLLPVERHIVGVLRSEFVELCVAAARESLLADADRNFIWAGPRVPRAEWLTRWESAVAVREGLSSVISMHGPNLALPVGARSEIGALLRADFLGLAFRLEASPRVQFWVSAHHLACGDLLAAADLAHRLTQERLPLYRKHAFDVLGATAIALGRLEEARDAYMGGLSTAEELGDRQTDVAVSSFNLICLGVELEDAGTLTRAVAAIRGLRDAGVDCLLDQQIDLLKANGDDGARVRSESLAWAKRQVDSEEPRTRRLFDALG
ncbi:MAG: hypothetical protein K8S98_12815 [Planctomycetes bacterium]|nr:hypothetical protein [Planctomycetota bacterium]